MNAECRMPNAELDGQFLKIGFQVFEQVFSARQCESLLHELSGLFDREQNISRSKIGGVRNLLSNPNVASFASSSELISFLTKLAGREIFPVRAIFFDKTAESNWRVPWHQDLAIAVAERIETEGFKGWSVKEGIPHVLPPTSVLERMVTLRLHLDDCDANNGALKVIPGSHRFGKLETAGISEIMAKEQAVTCEVLKGGMLVMHPLLLHSSSPAKTPSHRRILHIEYSADKLPNGLRWFEWQ